MTTPMVDSIDGAAPWRLGGDGVVTVPDTPMRTRTKLASRDHQRIERPASQIRHDRIGFREPDSRRHIGKFMG
jgi:hypothetical protein